MNESIISVTQREPRSISQEIRSRTKQRFDPRTTDGYKWVFTHYFYGRGRYLGLTTFENHLSGPATTVPILYRDDATWNLPVFRHRHRLYEFFVPGLTRQSVDSNNIGRADFYPLTTGEKQQAKEIIRGEFEETFEREITCLREYARINAQGDPAVKLTPDNFKPREFSVLFGPEVYQGENPGDFEARRKNSKYQPSIEIYVWEHGFRPAQPKKIN